jgi:hypothetical protein
MEQSTASPPKRRRNIALHLSHKHLLPPPWNNVTMTDRLSPDIGRRDLRRVLTLGAVAVTSSACVPFASAESEGGSTPGQAAIPGHRKGRGVPWVNRQRGGVPC